MKLKLFALVVVASLVAAASSLGGGSPLVAKQLGAGTMAKTRITIHAKAGSTMIFERYLVRPGGSFPWHVHPGPAAAAVTKGTLTVLDPANGCVPVEVPAGAAFIEPPNHLHTARNEGKGVAVVYVAYIGVPQGSIPVIPKPAPTTPAACTG